jgi:hypothetical protein
MHWLYEEKKKKNDKKEQHIQEILGLSYQQASYS